MSAVHCCSVQCGKLKVSTHSDSACRTYYLQGCSCCVYLTVASLSLGPAVPAAGSSAFVLLLAYMGHRSPDMNKWAEVGLKFSSQSILLCLTSVPVLHLLPNLLSSPCYIC